MRPSSLHGETASARIPALDVVREVRMFDETGEDDLLLTAMMKLGAAGGALGGTIGGAAAGESRLSGAAGARGGARGAARGFKLTKKDVAEQAMHLGMDVPEASHLVHRALESVGQVVGRETHVDGSVAMRAILGVGLAGLNPAVVTAWVVAGPAAGTAMVRLRAAGREGLIKRHPAGRALAQVASLLPAMDL
jgi:hypothetical protein